MERFAMNGAAGSALQLGCEFRLIRLPDVLSMTGLSRSEVYRRIKLGCFPLPIKLGVRASAWSQQEINEWCVARIAERNVRAKS